MEISKQLFEDVLSGKLKGTFVLRDKSIRSSNLLSKLKCSYLEYPYLLDSHSYTPDGLVVLTNKIHPLNIEDFIPDTDMKENELTIEIPDGKIIDWDESKKQNKIVLKNEQLTYEEICEKLFKDECFYINDIGGIDENPMYNDTSNNAATEHQLECILAKNKLATVAKYLNDGWKPSGFDFGYFICVCDKICEINRRNNYKFNNNVIFKSGELAQQAIEILGEKTVKLALEPLGI